MGNSFTSRGQLFNFLPTFDKEIFDHKFDITVYFNKYL